MEREREEGLMREGASSVSLSILILSQLCQASASIVRNEWTELTILSDASSWRGWRARSDNTAGWAGREAFAVGSEGSASRRMKRNFERRFDYMHHQAARRCGLNFPAHPAVAFCASTGVYSGHIVILFTYTVSTTFSILLPGITSYPLASPATLYRSKTQAMLAIKQYPSLPHP